MLAHRQPEIINTAIAREVGWAPDTVRVWQKRWNTCQRLLDLPRPGPLRIFSPPQRDQITALACSCPKDHGKVFKRWNGEKLGTVAVEEKIADKISSATVRTWLREDKIKPWRYHSWQKSTDPDFAAKAEPVLDLYEGTWVYAQAEILTVCADEKTSIQARQHVKETRPVIERHPVRVADRYKRMEALQSFCALAVASSLTITRTFARKCFGNSKSFCWACSPALFARIQVLNLILDNGPSYALKQLGIWVASPELGFEMRIFWLMKYASWLDQVEIILAKCNATCSSPTIFQARRL